MKLRQSWRGWGGREMLVSWQQGYTREGVRRRWRDGTAGWEGVLCSLRSLTVFHITAVLCFSNRACSPFIHFCPCLSVVLGMMHARQTVHCWTTSLLSIHVSLFCSESHKKQIGFWLVSCCCCCCFISMACVCKGVFMFTVEGEVDWVSPSISSSYVSNQGLELKPRTQQFD